MTAATTSASKMPCSLTEGELWAARGAARRRSTGSAPAAPTSTLSTSYKLLKTIGEGAFGAVSKARDLRTGEVVAIKSSRDGGGDAVLLREAALLAACGANPAVVRLREVVRTSETDMRLHLVLEYAGRSLSETIDLLRDHGQTFTESEVRRFMAELLAGVHTMHAHGVIHCDLKPANVLVGAKDSRLRICDLGLAKSVAAPPPPDKRIEGTLGYIAPEVLLGEKDCGEPVDVWALGCILGELITGQTLFEDADVYQELADIVYLLRIPDKVSGLPIGILEPEPSKLRERVPEKVLSEAGFDVLRGLLEYNPNDRLTAAAALKMPWFQEDDDCDLLPARCHGVKKTMTDDPLICPQDAIV